MRQHAWEPRLCSTAIVLALVTGCTGGGQDERPPDVASTAPDSIRMVEREQEDSLPAGDSALYLTATGPSGGGPRVAMVRRPTPLLDERIDELNVVKLLLYLNRLAYEEGPTEAMEAERACKTKGTTEDCPAGTTTRVLIQPEFGNTLIDLDDVNEGGVVVARFINRGRDDEARYGISRGKAWWVVVRDSKGNLRSQIVERTWNPLKAARVVSDHPFDNCDHAGDNGNRVAKAHWNGCGRGLTESTARTTHFSFASLVTPPSETLQAASWVTCPLGCCIAGDVQ